MEKDSLTSNNYKVQIYTEYGHFDYEVGTLEQAMEHAHVIMARGVYRRVNKRGELEWHKVIKTKVVGDVLGEVGDTFYRT